jgi:hypothetical protein
MGFKARPGDATELADASAVAVAGRLLNSFQTCQLIRVHRHFPGKADPHLFERVGF